MSLWCDITAAVGLALVSCADPGPTPLPEEDPGVWLHQAPEPPPPAPPPPEPVEKIIERVIVQVPVETPPTEPTSQDPPEPTTGYNVAAVDSLYRLRRRGGLDATTPPALAESTVPDPGNLNNPAAGAPPLPPPPRYIHPGLAGGDPVDNERILTEDRYITGNLETSINSQLDGSVIIQTSRNIYGYHGRQVLLPKGSRMVCDYDPPEKIGEHRVALECNRVFTAEHRAEIYQVAAPGGDVQGRAGITGDVDNRFLESYGAAFVLTFISAATRAAVAASRDENSPNNSQDQILDEAGEEISTRFGEITASVLQRTINLKPIITIPQGTRVQIRPASDWYIRPILEDNNG